MKLKGGVCVCLLLCLLQLTYLKIQVAAEEDENPPECPQGQTFNSCGPPCTATCDDKKPVCIGLCEPKCECPEAKPYLYGDECVEEESCPEATLDVRCLRQLELSGDADLLQKLTRFFRSVNATREDVKAIYEEVKDHEKADSLDKCLQLLSQKLTSGNCTKEDAVDGVCRNPNPDGALSNCQEFKCDALLEALGDESCFSEDEEKFEEKKDLVHFLAEDPECRDRLEEIPDEALVILDEEDILDFVTDNETVKIVIDKFNETGVLPLKSCEFKLRLAKEAFSASGAREALQTGEIDETVKDVLKNFLPFFSTETCNFVISTSLNYLVNHSEIWSKQNFECRDEDNPRELYMEEDKEEEAKRKKRDTPVDDAAGEYKEYLAESEDESCELTCGKAVAKAILGEMEVNIEAAADKCSDAQEKMGELYKCLDDRSKKFIITCDITEECMDTFNSKDFVNDEIDEKQCDKSTSNSCDVWCSQGDLGQKDITEVCALALGNRSDCMRVQECYQKLNRHLSKCIGNEDLEALIQETRIGEGDFRLSDLEGEIGQAILDEYKDKSFKDRTDEEQAALDADARQKVADKTTEEIKDDPDFFIINIGGIDPENKKEIAQSIVNDKSMQEIKDLLVNVTTIEAKKLKSLIIPLLDKEDFTMRDLPEVVTVTLRRSDIPEHEDPIQMCTLTNYEHDIRKMDELSTAVEENLKELAGSDDPSDYLTYLPEDLDKACYKSINATNIEALPEDNRVDIVLKIVDPQVHDRFERDSLCKAYLRLVGKDLDDETVTFVSGDETEQGYGCLLHISDFGSVLEKLADEFLVPFLMRHAPHPSCLPDNVLQSVDILLERLAAIYGPDYPVSEYSMLLNYDVDRADDLLDIMDAYLYDLRENIEAAKEECQKTKEDRQLDAESAEEAKERQDNLETTIKEKRVEMTETSTGLEEARRKRSVAKFGRFKRSEAYDCAYITTLGDAVTTLSVDQINTVTDSEFLKCVHVFGNYEYSSDYHHQTLMQRSLTVLELEACDINIDDVSQLGYMVYGLSVDQLVCMNFTSDLIYEFGFLTGWSSEQSGTITVGYMSSAGLSITTLTGDHLLKMRNTICGISDILSISPAEFFGVVDSLSDLDVTVLTTDCVTSYATLLKDETAYGPVSAWDSITFGEVGNFVGGLNADELNTVDQEKMDAISNGAIKLIAPDELSGLSLTTLGLLNRDQADSVTQTQEDALTYEQRTVLYQRKYGDGYTITDDDDDDGGDGTDGDGDGATYLAVSMGMLLTSLFGTLWL